MFILNHQFSCFSASRTGQEKGRFTVFVPMSHPQPRSAREAGHHPARAGWRRRGGRRTPLAAPTARLEPESAATSAVAAWNPSCHLPAPREAPGGCGQENVLAPPGTARLKVNNYRSPCSFKKLEHKYGRRPCCYSKVNARRDTSRYERFCEHACRLSH